MLTDAQRIANYRTRQREAGLPDSSRANRKEHKRLARRMEQFKQKPFVGCDGEGCGTDELGRQLYMLFRIGDRELFTGKPLTTFDMLDFICDAPDDAILVGFAFGYDVTMILRDFPEERQRWLMGQRWDEEKQKWVKRPRGKGKGFSNYTWFKEFDVDYLPKNYIRVRRMQIMRDPETGWEKRVAVPGSTRTIYETFGFFQKSFLKAVESFDIGTPADRKRIAENKARRETFTEITREEREYCALECDYLAQLMEKLRGYCNSAGIRPHMWAGAGKLAAALHTMHETPKAKVIEQVVPKRVRDWANMAYYGGRFEITRTGLIRQKVWEYDIRSAYPGHMGKLPCLVHGSWKRFGGSNVELGSDLFVAAINFRHSWPSCVSRGSAALGGFPVRSKEGYIYWPSKGGGIYWSPEIEAAQKVGAKVKINGGYKFVPGNCDCKPFAWVKDLYNYRRSIGSAGPGYPIKLGSNSLYGKMQQRVGNATFKNDVWGGLITAYTRAQLLEAVAQAPGQIVMIATDALYSLVPLDLDCSDELGNWDCTELNGLFIVQPGLYWCPEKRKKKSRGLPGKFFEGNGLTNAFENEWHNYEARSKAGEQLSFPVVPVPVPGFVGMKLALSRNKPETGGTWVKDTREISFDYRNKRLGHTWADGHIVTRIKPGAVDLVSLPYRDFLKGDGAEPWEAARLMIEEQPDHVDFGPPFED